MSKAVASWITDEVVEYLGDRQDVLGQALRNITSDEQQLHDLRESLIAAVSEAIFQMNGVIPPGGVGAELGKVYRDTVSGFVGTATRRTVFLHSVPQICLEAETGPIVVGVERWFTESRLVLHQSGAAGFASSPSD